MKKWTICGEGHVYGGATAVGAGILRSVCAICDGVRLENKDQPVRANDLFTSEQDESKVFGARRMSQTSAFLAIA